MEAMTPTAFLDVGRVHRQPDQVSLGGSNDMALAAFDLLADVVTTQTGNVRGLCRLAVDDTGARARLATKRQACRSHQVEVDGLPQPVVPPGIEIALNRRDRREPIRQCPPLAAGPGDVEEHVHDRPKFCRPRSSRCLRSRQERLEQRPFPVRQRVCISLPRAAISPAGGLRPTHVVIPFKSRQLKRITTDGATQPLPPPKPSFGSGSKGKHHAIVGGGLRGETRLVRTLVVPVRPLNIVVAIGVVMVWGIC